MNLRLHIDPWPAVGEVDLLDLAGRETEQRLVNLQASNRKQESHLLAKKAPDPPPDPHRWKLTYLNIIGSQRVVELRLKCSSSAAWASLRVG